MVAGSLFVEFCFDLAPWGSRVSSFISLVSSSVSISRSSFLSLLVLLTICLIRSLASAREELADRSFDRFSELDRGLREPILKLRRSDSSRSLRDLRGDGRSSLSRDSPLSEEFDRTSFDRSHAAMALFAIFSNRISVTALSMMRVRVIKRGRERGGVSRVGKIW